jgi:pimeloyl-ACP methyl ester carboxylesterase
MPSFSSDGLTLAYFDEGRGDPIVLVHGFASSIATNWIGPSWSTTLLDAGRRVIAIDNRGHGASEKPTDPDRYRSPLMAEDVAELLEHLDVERVDIMGYSMGARISAFFALAHPSKVRSLILGGLGSGLYEGVGNESDIIAALEAPSLDDATTARGRMFRTFAEQSKGDLKALAACMRALQARVMTPGDVARITAPTLVAVGTRDTIAGDPHALAALMPNARVLEITNRDHMPAVGDKIYKRGVLDFLAERP